MPEGLEIGHKYRHTTHEVVGTCVEKIEDINGCQHAVLVAVCDTPNGPQPFSSEAMDVWLEDADTGERVTRGTSFAEGKLGVEYEDKITGFKGVAVRRKVYAGNGAQLILQPPYDAEKGEIPKRYGIDEQTLVRVEDKQPVSTTATGGGDMTMDTLRPE
jgi:hypothetical protein